MHSRLLHHFLISVQVFSITLVVTAAALAPSKSLLPTTQAVGYFNDVVGIVQKKRVAASRTLFNGSDNIAQHVNNKTLPSFFPRLDNTDGMIRFKVSDCPTTLDFHHIGQKIPGNVVLQTITAAIAVASRKVVSGDGHEMLHLGWFRWQQPFVEGSVVDFAVGDFREEGRPINYYILCDILRGIVEFMMLPENGYHEVRFEVEVMGVGYTASGRVNYDAGASSVA